MASLQNKDWLKNASNGPYSNKSRDEIFELKIKDKKPFIIGENKNGIKVTGISYEKKSREFTYQDASKNVKTVPYTKVFKDGDFGGGAGSGGGAEDTALTESLQCFYCSYIYNVTKKQINKANKNYPSDSDLKAAGLYVQTDKTLEQCLKDGPSDWLENEVYIKTANKLFEKVKFAPGTVYFHRGSAFMKAVYSAKNATQIKDLASDNPQAPGSFSDDKWNPGDIWASTFSTSEKPLEKFTNGWGELNAEVLRLAGNPAGNGSLSGVKLLGISLKKVHGQTASLTEFSSPAQIAQKKKYTWDNWTFGSSGGDFFSSNDIYVTISGIKMQMRSFSGSWQGEVKGASAAGGKIGGGNVDFYCKKHFGKSIFGTKTGRTAYKQFITESTTTGFNYEDKMYEMYKAVNTSGKGSTATLSATEFKKRLKEKLSEPGDFRDSKLMCLMFLDIAMGSTSTVRNTFATDLFRYASSDTDQSSYFVKLA